MTEIRDGYFYCGIDRIASRSTRGEVVYRATSTRGSVHSASFARPIVGGVVVTMNVDCPDFPDGFRRSVGIRLSCHYYEEPVRYRLRFELVGPDRERTERVEGDSTVVVEVPCPTGRSELHLDLEEAARLLRDGEDDCLQALSWGITTDAAPGVFGVGKIRIESTRHDRDTYVRSIREILDRYEKEYGVREIMGGEYSLGGVHLNAFLPDSTRTPDRLLMHRSREVPTNWVRSVHRAGAVVSLNHPFGAMLGTLAHLSDEATRSKIDTVAKTLLDADAYGADILEVGYPKRTLPLQAHLDLWDRLTAHGLFLYGNGTSDRHGDIWFQTPDGNYYHTWVWAKDRSADALLRGMRSGRMYFGDISRWTGEFDFWVGPYAAGARAETTDGELPLRFRLDPMPEGCSVRLVQGMIDPSRTDVRYVREGVPIQAGWPYMVDVDKPCFFRLEAYLTMPNSGEEVPLLFSNSIVFTDRERSAED